MSRARIQLPCLYDSHFEQKANYSITCFLDETFSRNDEFSDIVRKTHDFSRRYFDSALIANVVKDWRETY